MPVFFQIRFSSFTLFSLNSCHKPSKNQQMKPGKNMKRRFLAVLKFSPWQAVKAQASEPNGEDCHGEIGEADEAGQKGRKEGFSQCLNFSMCIC